MTNSIQDAYNIWASQYDNNDNKTRDLEAVSLRETLSFLTVNRCLEVGCGTGKNSEWLQNRAGEILAVDLSGEMLALAKHKIKAANIHFVQADILQEWNFAQGQYDLITFSLVLEHIENLDAIFAKAAAALHADGFIYVGELHPFKQYIGSKARFDTEEGRHILTCYTHHLSQFFSAAKKSAFRLVEMKEYFDEPEETGIPRILVLLFQKK